MGRMLEREAEVGRLAAAVDRAAHGEGGVVVIEGAAGIGKSRLLDAARELARERGLRTLDARGEELAGDVSFGVVAQLLEREVNGAAAERRARLLAGAAELSLPALGVADAGASAPVDASFAICHGLYWLVANLALEGPLLLVVDDAHWADAPSLRALLHLAPRLDGLPVLVVAAARPAAHAAPAGTATAAVAIGPAANALLLEQLVQVAEPLRPAPLSDAAVGALLAEPADAPPPDAVVAAAARATAGNPFLVEALLQTMRADGIDAATADPERIAALNPEAVRGSLLRRLGGLPEGATAAVRAVAVLAARAELRHVAALAQLDDAHAARAADALVAAELLAPERPLAFVHPLVRTAVYEEIDAATRSALHARAARLLRAEGVAATELAPHLLATAPAGDPTVVETLREAARRALHHGAPDLAVRHLTRALQEPPAPGADTAAVLGELGHAEWLGGQAPAQAVAHLRQALDGTPDPAQRPEPALALHRALFAAGQVTESFALLEGELERIAGVADPDDVLRVESELASIGLLHPSTVALANDRLARFEHLEGATPTELLQLANVACWKWASGTAEETIRFGERSLADARFQAADAADSIPIYEALWALCYADAHELALAVLDDTLADARARGSVFGVTTSCALRAVIANMRGDTARAEVEARTGSEVPGLGDFVRPPIFGALTLALVARGRLVEAEEAVAQSGCGPDLPEFVCLNPVFYARGALRLAQGRFEEALADFRELGERGARVGLTNPGDPWRLGAAQALLRLGRADEAVTLADEQLALARRWGTSSAIGIALHGRALAHGGEDPAALAEAAEALAASPARLDEARCLVDLGSALHRAGQRAEARERLRRGLELARACGATPLVQRAHAELLEAGARPRALAFSGVESLTASERRVADLAAAGLTNREIAQDLFVTAKTVENQLGRVYAKLGIGSRGELPAALRDAGPAPAADDAPAAASA